VHYLDHEIIDSKLIEHRDLRELYKAYFSEVIYSIKCGLFDVIGHLDFPRRFVGNKVSRVRDLDYKRGMNAVLGVILEKKMYLEINSSLLEETEMMPSKETFRQFVENGGKLVSVGSDAHSTREVGHGIKEVLSFLEAFNEKKLKLLFE
jgi:histidinol-phosphatase (PHP family)